MRDPRNPFRMRASEHIASDSTFLRLFGGEVLDLLPKDNAFSHPPVIFRSSAGGGKTSILRVFTPSSLVNLHANRLNDDYKDLNDRMKALGAMDDNGPRLLGIMLSCAKNFAVLDDLPWDAHHKQKLFFAFLNCRIILAALKSALQLHNLEYPQQLSRLSIQADPDDSADLEIAANSDGNAIFEWARLIESEISKALDSFDPQPPTAPGHEKLTSLGLLKPERFLLDGKPIAPRVLVMFDDVHKLSSSQRLSVGKALTEMRDGVPTWLAERLEALTTEELLDVGSKHGRDYDNRALTLERHWRNYPGRFEKTVSAIADKRVRESLQVEIGSFANCVQSNLETPDMRAPLDQAAATAEIIVREKWEHDHRFEEWLASADTEYGTSYEQGLAWQTLDILATRESRKSQLSFVSEGFALSPEELHKQDDSAVKAAAELFFAHNSRLPYYFGLRKLSALASHNIEQFLAIAGELFEEASSSAILKRPPQLSVQRQHSILKRAAKQWWEQDVLRAVPQQSEVRRFVEAIGRVAQNETNRPNAPYAPGVTGISITMIELDQLRDEKVLSARPDLKRLASVIGICLAHNILEADLDRSQGYERRMLLYLNRLLCCHFDLPLQYGGYRARKVDDLARWVVSGYRQTSLPEEPVP